MLHRYTDNVVGPLLSAQMYNPEFDWTSSINTQDNKVAEVIDKLRHIRQVSSAIYTLVYRIYIKQLVL